METGLTAFANPRKGLLGRRAIHAESPFFLILPSRRATKKVADHSSLQPLEWSAFDWLFRSCSRTGRRSSPTSFFWLSYGAADAQSREWNHASNYSLSMGTRLHPPESLFLTPTTMSVAVSLVMALIVLNPTDELCRS